MRRGRHGRGEATTRAADPGLDPQDEVDISLPIHNFNKTLDMAITTNYLFYWM